MIQRLNVHVPIHALSFGNVSFNLLRELYRRKVQCTLFFRGNPDFTAFAPLDPQFGQWIERCSNGRFTKLDRKVPTLNLWHIRDSEFRPSDKQALLTFHETDSPTDAEINLVNQQDHTFFTSSWSVENFKTYGASNVSFVPLGVDEDFKPLPSRAGSNATQWLLTGKAEPLRKLTQLKIQLWIRKYGGDRRHFLNLYVHNPFIPADQMNAFYASCFPSGQKPFNVNILTPEALTTNAAMNQLYNNCDVDLSGLSRAEGWNLPAFMMSALGKWSAVTNCTAHKDWATSQNSVLVEPKGMVPAHDGVFFQRGGPFSQGNMYDFAEESLVTAMERLEQLAKSPNRAGLELRDTFTYTRTVDQILTKIDTL